MPKRVSTGILRLPIPTKDGTFVASYSAMGLCRLEFPKKGNREAILVDVPKQVAGWHKATVRALERVLTGREPGELPPLDLSGGTDFQQRVWREMLRIQAGRTTHYGAIAQAIGKPGASRAVGGACGANPIPVLVPCHRVLAANQRLGGFSGGLHWKRLLLEREGTLPAVSRPLG
jgi:O-6-methylguanine DNA methyltransferase